MSSLLDLAFLRSLVAIADSGSFTAAARAVHVTQSAMSLQIRKLEETVGSPLLERHPRGARLTVAGALLVAHARQALAEDRQIQDRIRALRSQPAFLRLGASQDILQPHVPDAIRLFGLWQPETRVDILSASSRILRQKLQEGDLDLILTTDFSPPQDALLLARREIVWIAAPHSTLWRQRPLPVCVVRGCQINAAVMTALSRSHIPWDVVVEAESERAVEVAVAADRAVHAMIASACPAFLAPAADGHTLPQISPVGIYLSRRPDLAEATQPLADCLIECFARDAA